MTSEFLVVAVSLAGVGCLAGFLSGMFGIGGGVILVPILAAAFAVQGIAPDVISHMAVGTSLGIIIPTAIRSFLAHRKLGAGNEDLIRLWVLWVPAGVIVASLIVPHVPGAVLRYVFAAIATVIAIKMLFSRINWQIAETLPPPKVNRGVGFGIGFLSTFMGIGGGNLNNLFMTVFGQSMHQAVATSAGLGVLIAIPGALGYVYAGWGQDALPVYALGYVNLLGVACVAPFSLLVAPLGARVAHSLDARVLETCFGLFLLVVVAAFVFA